jgi:hypothetical protein
MPDSRFNSCHLGLDPRRQEYRRARAALLEDRGWLTLAGEHMHGFVPSNADWLSLFPSQLPCLPNAKYLLVDRETGDPHGLRTGLNTIGRISNNDIVFTERTISRRHCVILVHARGACDLHDTASRNGTFVNGQRVRCPVSLHTGDMIQVCKKELCFASVRDYLDAVEDEPAEATSVG